MTQRRALVVFDSRHGNTARVAAALARGLSSVPGLVAEAAFEADVRSDRLESADLIVIGGPTEAFSASSHLRKFFDRIGAFDLHGKFGFAFDTHAKGPLTGSAGAFIEKWMKRLGLALLEPHRSAYTISGGGLTLSPGSEAEFEHVGAALGRELLDALARRPPPPEVVASTFD